MNRDFKGIWIPREIWESDKLTLQEKVFYVEIDSLDNGEKGCYANNNYFAKFFGVSTTRVSLIIKQLIDKGFITSEINVKEGNKRILKTSLRKVKDPIQHKLIHNNIINNTINNNTINQSVDWSNLLILFNNITSKKTKVIPEKAKRQILARLKEGWTKDDIRKAIKNCYKDEHHITTKHKYCTLELISRAEKFERFATMNSEISEEEEETLEERAIRLQNETKNQKV